MTTIRDRWKRHGSKHHHNAMFTSFAHSGGKQTQIICFYPLFIADKKLMCRGSKYSCRRSGKSLFADDAALYVRSVVIPRAAQWGLVGFNRLPALTEL